jgi:hypothetical protein
MLLGKDQRLQVSFTRHRYEMPMLWMFLSLASIELFAVHLLASLWSSTAAWVLSALTVLGLAHIALLMRGLITSPTLLDDDGLTIRHGTRSEIFVPLGSVTRIEDVAFQPEQKGPQTFRATILAQPNLCVHLSPALPFRDRTLSTICLRLDDPAFFRTELRARLEASSTRSLHSVAKQG